MTEDFMRMERRQLRERREGKLRRALGDAGRVGRGTRSAGRRRSHEGRARACGRPNNLAPVVA